MLGIKKGVPEELRPKGTGSTGSGGDDGGYSGGAVTAIVVVVLIIAALVVAVVAGAVLVWFRRNRHSFKIMTGLSGTSEHYTSEGVSGGRAGSGRAFPMRAGSNTYVAVPATALAASRGADDGEEKGKEKDILEEDPKISHL